MTKTSLGARLKSLRTQKGFTMRELARLAGCSASFLSQLELNRASPSVANLEKICVALRMSIVDVLREEPTLHQPIPVDLHAPDHPLAMRWHRASLRHLLPQDAELKSFTALQLNLEVGGEVPARHSQRSINQLVVVLVGQVELRVDEKVFPLAPHSAIYFDLRFPHSFRNTGEVPAEVLLVHPYIFELFEKQEEDLIWSRRKDGARLFR